MIIVTSLSPSHLCKENQVQAIESWNQYGNCYSLNHPNEIEVLDYKNIDIIPTVKTVQLILGKPLININSIIDFAISKGQDLLIVNSDIILKDLPEFKEDGITVISRYDYDNTFEDAEVFKAGFDAFFIPKQLLNLLPPSIFSLGAAWWDYWLPMIAIKLGITLYYPIGQFAYHKKHATQYNHDEWLRLGEYFRLDFQLEKHLTVPQIATQTLNLIKSKLV
jgi:hypothetical protein